MRPYYNRLTKNAWELKINLKLTWDGDEKDRRDDDSRRGNTLKMEKEKNGGGRRRITDEDRQKIITRPRGAVAMPADSTEEILAVQADRQKNDRGWGIDRTDEYNVNTTTIRCEETEHYSYTYKTS